MASLGDDESLCPVRALKVYIRRTSPIRGNTYSLLIALRKPYKPVSSNTIARWLKEVLKRAGIDISKFKTRAATTSAARAKGISVEDIRKSAGCSRGSTFEKFHHRLQLDSTPFVESFQSGISLNNTLSYMKPCHEVELIIPRASEGCDMGLEFH